MANQIKYEWTLETLEDGDIIDSDFAESLPAAWLTEENTDLALVRNEGNENQGLQDRLWAYVFEDDGVKKLPEYFSEALGNPTQIKVPQKFHKELSTKL